MIRRQDRWPLGATGFVLAVSAAWWGLALWTVPEAPEWLERTRSVCFNLTETGLPDAKGWLLLFGQPPTMLAALFAGWPSEVKDTLRHVLSRRAGRGAAAATGVLVLAGLALAAVRVSGALSNDAVLVDGGVALDAHPRLERSWPAFDGVVDQNGMPFTLGSLAGRRAFVSFAFGHCETVCPVVVHASLEARLELGERFPIVVFTLDPWRDTESRLPALVEQFGLDPGLDFVVGGPVEAVEAALDAWNVVRQRDLRTGDITHPALVYLVEGDGTLAYSSTGTPRRLVGLATRLR